MAETTAVAVRRSDTAHPVFHGCIDWHSSVHGHWALLRIARVTGEHAAQAQWVVAALGPQEIASEAEFLRRHPGFEMPYGRAWFLRLAIEYESWLREHQQADANVLGDMPNEVASSLVDFCKSRIPTPDSREYDNDAWALAQLHAFYIHRQDEARLQEISNLIDKHFLTVESPIRFALDHQRPDFFSCFGNWAYLVATSQSTKNADAFWRTHAPSEAELRPVQPIPGRAHHLGINWSRAWALRAASRAISDPLERARLDAAYLEHVEAGWATHQRCKDDYGSYGHWVPQFAVYAMTE
jgi:hypothetical protein